MGVFCRQYHDRAWGWVQLININGEFEEFSSVGLSQLYLRHHKKPLKIIRPDG